MAASKQGASAMASTSANTADREMFATRVFDAPRELVWKMWTEPERISKWWGPRGFTSTTSQMDVRPGGLWVHVMHGPEGKNYPNRIVYVEVVKPERIVYDHESYPPFRATATFEKQGEKTLVTMRMIFETAELRDKTAKEFGAVEGLQQTIDRLGEELMAASVKELVLTREFPARREVVFKAWTDPKQMAKWWVPRGFTNPLCELDVRPGGKIRIDMHAPFGTVYPMTGEFNEVVPPERLVFTCWAQFDECGNAQLETVNTVMFAEHNGRTKITLHARVSKATAASAMAVAGMEQGWTESLVRLEELVRG
ncbi:MAG TPA: SRPBCC domain-containing protein [Candidatus Acidoferrum sp.]